MKTQTNLFNVTNAFFVLDSDHLEQAETRLYGFTMFRDQLVQDAASLQGEMPQGEGAYVYIRCKDGRISIRQDFMGSYGLYLYRDGDYFALSNSFLRLVDYLKTSRKLTLNEDYANYFVSAELCSVAFRETMVQQIECLDRCAEVEIDTEAKSLRISYLDYEENTVELSTPEGMRLLDSWYRKWTTFIRNLKASGAQLQADLSGGFDSRMTFTLLLGSGIDLSQVLIHSLNDGLHVHDEDYKIASAISEHFRFPLNNNSFISTDSWPYTEEDTLNISFYLKLCFHKQMYYRHNCLKAARHSFSGGGGECLRSYWKMTEEEYIEKAVNRCRVYPGASAEIMETSIRNVLQRSFDAIRSKFATFGRPLSPEDMTLYLYRETRCRNHFGKDVLENHFSNFLKHTPLLDPQIHRLKLSDSRCADHNLLTAVMLSRYSPALLDFPFEGGRKIDESTKRYARELNNRFPYIPAVHPVLSCGHTDAIWNYADMAGNNADELPTAQTDISSTVKSVLVSPDIRGSFCGFYDPKVYQILCDDIKVRKYQPLQNAYAIIGIGKILQDIAVSRNTAHPNISSYLLSGTRPEAREEASVTLQQHPYLTNFTTARMDLLVHWEDPGKVLLTAPSDKSARIIVPGWLKENTGGYSIESQAGTFSADLQFTGSGTLTFSLKGRDVRRNEGSRIPFWIDYQKLTINGETCFDALRPAWHDAPITVKRKVSKGDTLHFETTWTVHDERTQVPQTAAPISKQNKVKAILKRLLK